MRAEVNVVRAVGVPFAAFERGFVRGHAARMPLLLASVVASYVPLHHLSAPPGAARLGSRASRSNSSFKQSIQKMTAIKDGFLLSPCPLEINDINS